MPIDCTEINRAERDWEVGSSIYGKTISVNE